MSLIRNLLSGLAWLIAGAILAWAFPGLRQVIVLSAAFVLVLLYAGIIRLKVANVSGLAIMNLGLVLTGLGFIGYGMWTIFVLQTTGGIWSYNWFLAQANVFVGMISLGIPFAFRSPR